MAGPLARLAPVSHRREFIGRPRRWCRHHRRLTLFLCVSLATLVTVCVGTVVYLATLPGVGDAESRVTAILRRHSGRPLPWPPPRRLAAAIVATEDAHFYDNVVFNVGAGAARAAIAALGTSEDPGGSTIAQQLAKRLYPHQAGVAGTLEEIGLGVKLSLSYSHDQVLTMYLNSIYWGNGFWGVVAAADGYFGVSPRRLTWGEASLLAGLPQAPSAYDPLRHLTLARRRQRYVLDRLVADGTLDAGQADAAFHGALPLRAEG